MSNLRIYDGGTGSLMHPEGDEENARAREFFEQGVLYYGDPANGTLWCYLNIERNVPEQVIAAYKNPQQRGDLRAEFVRELERELDDVGWPILEDAGGNQVVYNKLRSSVQGSDSASTVASAVDIKKVEQAMKEEHKLDFGVPDIQTAVDVMFYISEKVPQVETVAISKSGREDHISEVDLVIHPFRRYDTITPTEETAEIVSREKVKNKQNDIIESVGDRSDDQVKRELNRKVLAEYGYRIPEVNSKADHLIGRVAAFSSLLITLIGIGAIGLLLPLNQAPKNITSYVSFGLGFVPSLPVESVSVPSASILLAAALVGWGIYLLFSRAFLSIGVRQGLARIGSGYIDMATAYTVGSELQNTGEITQHVSMLQTECGNRSEHTQKGQEELFRQRLDETLPGEKPEKRKDKKVQIVNVLTKGIGIGAAFAIVPVVLVLGIVFTVTVSAERWELLMLVTGAITSVTMVIGVILLVLVGLSKLFWKSIFLIFSSSSSKGGHSMGGGSGGSPKPGGQTGVSQVDNVEDETTKVDSGNDEQNEQSGDSLRGNHQK